MPDPISSLAIAAILMALGLFIFWPGRGPYWRWQQTRQMSERVLIEDAAGITKFKLNKRLTQLKLQRAGQNLERIEDLGPLLDRTRQSPR